MPSNLILSGGIFHDFAATSRALASLLTDVGVRSELIDDLDEGLNLLRDGHYEMVTVNALRWGMMTGDKYAPYREQWAYRISIEQQQLLESFVAGGGGLLGLHTSSICFDNWDGWRDLLGGAWRWGVSHHPLQGPVQVQPVASGHPVAYGIPAFSVVDEVYHHLDLRADVEVLFEGACERSETPQPLVWSTHFGRGRVVYDALGHDAASLEVPAHSKLLQQATRWLTEVQS